MKTISFLSYSDIHYHQYNNGLVLNDIISVEEEMLTLAISLNVDFILFGGDRYVSRNPMYETALASDRMLKKISDSGILWLGLIGNHDRWTKNDFKGHTMEHAKLYTNDLPNINIMDERKEYRFTTKTGHNVSIHAVPAGHNPDNIKIGETADFNICAFHALTINSRFHNGTLVETGLSVSSLNKKFDLVVGGDNHTRQEIKGFDHCRGFYNGAPCQHNWGDIGAERGFTLYTLVSDRGMPDPVFYQSHTPKFIKVDWVTDDTSKLLFAAANGTSDWKNNIIKLTMSGPADVLNDIDLDLWKIKLLNASSARVIDIKLNYESIIPQDEVRDGPITDADDWKAFMTSKAHDFDQIDIAHIEKLGLDYINKI